jgi:uncharacterized membrane protein
MKTLLTLYLLSGALLCALAIPLIQRRIGPNPLYGFRVEKTLSNPEVWYAANAYSGHQLLWIGIGTILVALALYFVPRINLAAYALCCAGYLVIALCVSLFLSFRYLSRL